MLEWIFSHFQELSSDEGECLVCCTRPLGSQNCVGNCRKYNAWKLRPHESHLAMCPNSKTSTTSTLPNFICFKCVAIFTKVCYINSNSHWKETTSGWIAGCDLCWRRDWRTGLCNWRKCYITALMKILKLVIHNKGGNCHAVDDKLTSQQRQQLHSVSTTLHVRTPDTQHIDCIGACGGELG